ncbi:diguanylate cyclase, partial [Thioclava sp. JE_KL1]|nr:diguanylate cyclase [Thioclava sp. JE_KL1]
IKKFMDEPLVYNIKTPLVDVSNDITEMGAQEKSAFIITEHGKYVGCGSFMDLLKVMTDLKVRSAKYANPLSGLPGNVPIQNKIQQYLDSNMPFSVIYVDVDHFKAYNDCYSFEQGDQVIAAIANVL